MPTQHNRQSRHERVKKQRRSELFAATSLLWQFITNLYYVITMRSLIVKGRHNRFNNSGQQDSECTKCTKCERNIKCTTKNKKEHKSKDIGCTLEDRRGSLLSHVQCLVTSKSSACDLPHFISKLKTASSHLPCTEGDPQWDEIERHYNFSGGQQMRR